METSAPVLSWIRGEAQNQTDHILDYSKPTSYCFYVWAGPAAPDPGPARLVQKKGMKKINVFLIVGKIFYFEKKAQIDRLCSGFIAAGESHDPLCWPHLSDRMSLKTQQHRR